MRTQQSLPAISETEQRPKANRYEVLALVLCVVAVYVIAFFRLI